MNRIVKICIVFAIASNFALTFAQQPIKVEIKKTTEGFTLLRAGEPYFVKGAGGNSYLAQLKANGGNSIRTWGTQNGVVLLNKAYSLGITVNMGLNVARERHGFNYDDTAAVRKQLERLRKEVRKYKDYPALLIWGIGNELNLDYKNPKVWDAVNDIAKMIHQEDPNHPATTMLAGLTKRELNYIQKRCPDLDFISLQVYGDLAKVPTQLKLYGWEGAYMVTEWGPTGHWECKKTAWGAPIEESSNEKALVYQSRYEASIAIDKNCMGSYVFLWGQKQERTPTWYGLFTEDGEETEVVDVMHQLWTGKESVERAPKLQSFMLDNKKATANIYLKAGQTYPLTFVATDPHQNKLKTRWELLPEATDLSQGGDRESRPQPIHNRISSIKANTASLTAPEKPGAYRVFIYVTNGKNKVATANIPFYAM